MFSDEPNALRYNVMFCMVTVTTAISAAAGVGSYSAGHPTAAACAAALTTTQILLAFRATANFVFDMVQAQRPITSEQGTPSPKPSA